MPSEGDPVAVGPPDPVLLGALLAASLGALLGSVFLRDYIRAVIAFAAGSAVLAAVFALFGAPFLSAVASYLPTLSAITQDPAVVLRDH